MFTCACNPQENTVVSGYVTTVGEGGGGSLVGGVNPQRGTIVLG